MLQAGRLAGPAVSCFDLVALPWIALDGRSKLGLLCVRINVRSHLMIIIAITSTIMAWQSLA